jgi:hypothetical protein
MRQVHISNNIIASQNLINSFRTEMSTIYPVVWKKESVFIVFTVLQILVLPHCVRHVAVTDLQQA